MSNLITILAIAFIITLLCTPIAIKIANKIGAMDVPEDERRMHSRPIPRLGGLALYAGAVGAILIYLPIDRKIMGLLIGATLIFIIGIIDDIRPMPAKVKLLGQVICALIVYYFGVQITFFGNPFGDLISFNSSIISITGSYIFFHSTLLSMFITVLWIVGITNTINLIDGLDGLAAGIVSIAAFFTAYVAYINLRPGIAMVTIAIAGCALGFLPLNFNPAKIFMGDGGSLFLGFMLAGLSVAGLMKGATAIATILPFFVLGLPIFDTAFAILRRVVNKRPIMQADKGHLHHRIMAKGLGQKSTVITLYSLSALMGMIAIILSRRLYFEALILFIIVMALVYVFIKTQSEDDEEMEKKHENNDSIRDTTGSN